MCVVAISATQARREAGMARYFPPIKLGYSLRIYDPEVVGNGDSSGGDTRSEW